MYIVQYYLSLIFKEIIKHDQVPQRYIYTAFCPFDHLLCPVETNKEKRRIKITANLSFYKPIINLLFLSFHKPMINMSPNSNWLESVKYFFNF